MSTPRIYSSCLRCERLERELEAARKAAEKFADGHRTHCVRYTRPKLTGCDCGYYELMTALGKEQE